MPSTKWKSALVAASGRFGRYSQCIISNCRYFTAFDTDCLDVVTLLAPLIANGRYRGSLFVRPGRSSVRLPASDSFVPQSTPCSSETASCLIKSERTGVYCASSRGIAAKDLPKLSSHPISLRAVWPPFWILVGMLIIIIERTKDGMPQQCRIVDEHGHS